MARRNQITKAAQVAAELDQKKKSVVPACLVAAK